jgi:hypothetical protein
VSPAILSEVFHGFLQSLQAYIGIVSRLYHYRFLPNPSQLIIHHSFYHPRIHTDSGFKLPPKEKFMLKIGEFRINQNPSAVLESLHAYRWTDIQRR